MERRNQIRLFIFYWELRQNSVTRKLHCLHKAQRGRIHAIPQSCRPRAVIEDVPQMSIALRARNRNPLYAQRAVVDLAHIFFRKRFPKARPACA